MLCLRTSAISSPLTFKRWTRKAYAAFNSLGRVVRIGVLWLGCSMILQPALAQKGTDTVSVVEPVREVELEEVVVSAGRVPVVQSELMRVVQVISRAEIERSVNAGIPSLLQNVRGVDVRTRGPMGIQSDIGIRGGTFDQTLILLNGINISDPQTGHHKLNLPVDLQSVERIEVLSGPGARIFGPNAFNGAINVITRTPGAPLFRANLTGGEYGYFVAGVSGGFATGNVGHHLSISRSGGTGYIPNTDFRNMHMFYRANHPGKHLLWDVQAGFNNKAFGANSFYTPRFPEQYEETQTRFASIQTSARNHPELSVRVYWRQHHDRFELFRYEAPQWYAGHNFHRSDVAGASLGFTRVGRTGKTNAGIDMRYEHIFSNVLGELLDQPKEVRGEENALFTRAYDRSHISVFAEQSYHLGRFSLSGGGLLYATSGLDQIDFFPGIDLGYQFTSNWRWYATANRTLRLPTFTDLFYRDPSHQGNPDLLPEEAVTFETGVKASWQVVAFDIAGFHRLGRNLIDWVMAPGETIWRSMNHTRMDISGVEAGLLLRPQQGWGVSENSTLSIQYSYIYADIDESDFRSRYALDQLRHTLKIAAAYEIFPSFDVSLSITWRDRNGGYMLFENNAFTHMVDFEPYWLTDINFRYRLGQFTISAGATNLFNTQFVSVANVRQPGRWFLGGLAWQWGQD